MNFKAVVFDIYSKEKYFFKVKVQKWIFGHESLFSRLVIYYANVKEGILEKSTWRHERLHSKACRYTVEPSKTIDAVQLWRFLDTCRMHIMHPCRYNQVSDWRHCDLPFFEKSTRSAAVQFWSTGFYIHRYTYTHSIRILLLKYKTIKIYMLDLKDNSCKI